MAYTIICYRPLTPILNYARHAPTILAYYHAADFAIESSLLYPHGP